MCTQGNFIVKCWPLNLIYKCHHLVPYEGIICKDIAMFHLENEAKEIMFKHQLWWYVWYNYNLTYYDAKLKIRPTNPNLKNQI